MTPNPGRVPTRAAGKRVRVRFVGQARAAEHSYPADGNGGLRWTKTGSPFDIAEFEVVG